MKIEFENLKVGAKAGIKEIATTEKLQKYAEASSDYNEIHFIQQYVDQNFSKNRGVFIHGLFAEGLISRLLGMHLPGSGTIILNQNIDYIAPIYVNDEIEACVEIKEIKREKRIVKLDILCTNQYGDITVQGATVVKVLPEYDSSRPDLRLRKLQDADLEMIREWRMLPEVTKYMYTDPVLTFEEQKKWYERIKTDDLKKYWIINYGGMDIGLLNLYDIDYANMRCEWAYYIADTSFRGKGIARNLECNIYDYVFFDLNMNKLGCEVFSFNDSVVRIHEKFGSEIEGVRKEHIIKNGEKYDIVLMAMSKEKWERIRTDFSYETIEIQR